MHIRVATAADVPGILSIYNEAVMHTTASYDYEPFSLADRLAWFEEHRAQNLPVYVAETADGDVAGWSSLSQFRSKIGYQFTVENSIYIAAEHRGNGLGKHLLNALISGARERGLHVIVAGMDSANEASLRLHASMGFQPVAHFKQVGYKFGRWLDVIFMQLIVEP